MKNIGTHTHLKTDHLNANVTKKMDLFEMQSLMMDPASIAPTFEDHSKMQLMLENVLPVIMKKAGFVMLVRMMTTCLVLMEIDVFERLKTVKFQLMNSP